LEITIRLANKNIKKSTSF